MDTITTFIMNFTALIVALTSLIVALVKAKKEVANVLPKKIKTQCSVDIDITDKLEELKEYLKADRVQIYDFHNGGHYANGRSALKTSCSFEAVRSGVKSYQKELQAVPLSCISKFVQHLLKNGQMQINDLEEIKETMPATYELKRTQNIASFYDVILNNKDCEPVGFLAIQYSNKNKVNFTEDEKAQILKTKFFVEENLEKMAKPI